MRFGFRVHVIERVSDVTLRRVVSFSFYVMAEAKVRDGRIDPRIPRATLQRANARVTHVFAIFKFRVTDRNVCTTSYRFYLSAATWRPQLPYNYLALVSTSYTYAKKYYARGRLAFANDKYLCDSQARHLSTRI